MKTPSSAHIAIRLSSDQDNPFLQVTFVLKAHTIDEPSLCFAILLILTNSYTTKLLICWNIRPDQSKSSLQIYVGAVSPRVYMFWLLTD